MRLYRLHWTDEGILWRREKYVIMKPGKKIQTWRLRRVKGLPGEQASEGEATYKKERLAFCAGNKAVREEQISTNKKRRKKYVSQ